MKIYPALAAVLVLAAPLAAQTPESAVLRGASSFSSLSAFKFDPKAAVAPLATPKPVEPPKPAIKSSRYVSVSGQLSLQGSGYLSSPSGYVSVNLNGWVTVQDATGHVRSNMENVTVFGQFFVNGGWVNQTVWPNAYVSLYKDGKFIGQGRVDGSIWVSGYANGNWLNLNGSGTVTGNVLVND